MERAPIVSQYYHLRDYLNRANKLADKATTVGFGIEHGEFSVYRLFAICEGQNESHRIAVAERTVRRQWERAGYTPFRELEEFCAARLNKHEEELDFPRPSRILTAMQIKKMEDEMKEIFRRLLLNKNYEP